MHVLLVGGQSSDHQTLARIGALGMRVQTARDRRAASAILARERFDAILVDASFGPASLRELVAEVRARELDSYCHVTVLLTTSTRVVVAAAFATGADDVIKRPFVAEEIVGRLASLTRIRRWATRAAAAGDFVSEVDPRRDLSALRAWREADVAIGLDFRGVLGRDIAVIDRGEAVRDGLSAQLPLTLVSDAIGVSVVVAVSSASLSVVSQLVFGCVMPDAALADVVRELTNTAAGAFKRVAETEGIAMTMGLPTERSTRELARPLGACRDVWMRVVGTDAEIHCRLVVGPRSLERLSPASLVEGMVLTHDLLSDQGTLLLPSGTRLSETAIVRLTQLLPPTSVIEIARVA
jgi:CheY-like chemotaxis protein